MRHYFTVYVTLLRLNLARLLAYRGNFINSLIASIVWGTFSFIFIFLLTSKTSSIYGWTRDELILLMALYNIVIGGIFHMFFSRNFDKFSVTVHLGQLDQILLKPIDSQFLLSSLNIGFTQISRIIMGLGVAIYIINKIKLPVTLIHIGEFIALSIVGLILLYSIWFLVLTLTIWFSRLSNLVDLLYHLNDLTRFPPQMFNSIKNYAFFILPYTLILVTPTKAMLHNLTLVDTAELLFFSLTLFYLSRRFWKFALKYYTSASS